MKTKPREELYDLKSDPYEVHNVSDDPKYASKLTILRKALAHWQLEIGDKGFVPEHDLIEMFWPERLQPGTTEVFFEKDEKGRVELQCNTVGASIGYQLDDEIGSSKWRLYHKPIKITKNQSIAARAIRIGFKASRITSNENTIK